MSGEATPGPLAKQAAHSEIPTRCVDVLFKAPPCDFGRCPTEDTLTASQPSDDRIPVSGKGGVIVSIENIFARISVALTPME
jgi:hypothetical protein